MADKHKHHHHHHHHHEDDHVEASESQVLEPTELDAAGRSLSDALRISFVILKVIMIVLVVAFLASGFRTVDSGEKALVLRFGRIVRVLDSGPHWIIPYPVDELVKVPVTRKVNLAINSFWYKETREDVMGEGPKPRRYFPDKLNPLQEGYCLTRSQRKPTQPVGVELSLTVESKPDGVVSRIQAKTNPALGLAEDVEGSDYNIVHSKWQIIYQIEALEQFFRNVYIEDVKPGQVYFDQVTEDIAPLLRSVVEDAVVDAMVHYTIDEALVSKDTIPRRVQQLAQKKLSDIESGIRVTSVQLVDVEWPKQVNDAFEAFFAAGQQSQTTINEAKTYAENTLNNTAGRVAGQLFRALRDDTVSEEQRELLWGQVAGQAQDIIAQAKAYQLTVVASAEANADYLLSLLPEYNKRPELVVQKLYLDTIEQVLQNADEKFILGQADTIDQHELRVLVNRDAALKPKKTQ
jgi:regulator of protease activity HflC (stomatin/prohibitin superfamily)